MAVKACAICHSDIIMADGGWGGVLPAVYGHEAAGEVEAVGAGVDHVWCGAGLDHVESLEQVWQHTIFPHPGGAPVSGGGSL